MVDGVAGPWIHGAPRLAAPHFFDVLFARAQANRRAGAARNGGRESRGNRRRTPRRRFRSGARRGGIAAGRAVARAERIVIMRLAGARCYNRAGGNLWNKWLKS